MVSMGYGHLLPLPPCIPFGWTPTTKEKCSNGCSKDYLILLSEGRLVNLGNATGHPSRIMDGSFANQVLAQMYLYERAWADHDPSQRQDVTLEVLPKALDEEVASYMVEGFGGIMTKMTKNQADYIHVSQEGPFKPDTYKY